MKQQQWNKQKDQHMHTKNLIEFDVVKERQLLKLMRLVLNNSLLLSLLADFDAKRTIQLGWQGVGKGANENDMEWIQWAVINAFDEMQFSKCSTDVTFII